jgi:hypothetical protein
MRKKILFILFIVALASLCIGQEETDEKEQAPEGVEKWKEQLSFMSPPSGQDATSMIPAFVNAEELPLGTHIVYQIVSEGVSQGVDISSDMTMDFTLSGREPVKGIDCTVIDVVITADMESQGQAITMTIEGKEWIDADGVPVKVEEDITMSMGEFSIPLSLVLERTGEEQYHGHDCWVFSGTQTTSMMGMSTEGTVTEYMDKESYAVVRVITGIGGEEVDTGYMEPPVAMKDLEWVLGDTETITTAMGTYNCQIIYLKELGETVGTIWATEDVSAPIKYEYSYETEDSSMTMTMTLIEYTLG